MILLIDNYDSFTYNLKQYVEELGEQCRVVRNDVVSVDDVVAAAPTHVIISPGPGRPDDAGVCTDLVRKLGQTVPVLGVCLGHQVIAHAFGGEVVRGRRPFHGKTSAISHDGLGVFAGMPETFVVARYHSLVVRAETLPSTLYVTATAHDGAVMGIRHRDLPVEGVQFHPESIATESGLSLLQNFIGDN